MASALSTFNKIRSCEKGAHWSSAVFTPAGERTLHLISQLPDIDWAEDLVPRNLSAHGWKLSSIQWDEAGPVPTSTLGVQLTYLHSSKHAHFHSRFL